MRNECGTIGMRDFLDHAHFHVATPTILAKSTTTHKIYLPRPLNLEIYGQKQGSILTLRFRHTPFVLSYALCVMTSEEREFGTRAGHVQYFRDCPASFGTVGNYAFVTEPLLQTN
jgi:hypothetical protein